MTKFEQIDKKYFEQRKHFSEKYGLREIWDVIDHWPLYCGITNLSIRLTISDLLRSTFNVPGHVAEFGSWRGTNVLFMAKLLRIFDPHGSKIVHCFESFKGLNTFKKEDKNAVKFKGKYRGSFKELSDVISLYEMNDEIVIHKGLIEKKLPQAIREDKSLMFSFIYCDVDFYKPTKVILNLVHDRLSKGGLLVFDEWNNTDFPGEGQAVNEFLKKYGHKYQMRHVPYSRKPSLVLKKIEF